MKAKNSVFTFCTLVLVFLIMLTLIAFVNGRIYRQDEVQTSEEETSSSSSYKEPYFIGEIDYFFEAKGVYDSDGFKTFFRTAETEAEVQL